MKLGLDFIVKPCYTISIVKTNKETNKMTKQFKITEKCSVTTYYDRIYIVEAENADLALDNVENHIEVFDENFEQGGDGEPLDMGLCAEEHTGTPYKN